MDRNRKVSFTALVVLLLCLTTQTMALAASLYSEAQFKSMVSDHKARRVGDTITLLIVENASAQAQTDTALDESFGVDAGLNLTNRSEDGDLSLGMQRDSGGSTARKGSVRAQITVTVLETDENKRLFVAGEQKITINGEVQGITVSGWLRREDINENNVSISTRLADAEITYIGVGDPAETNEPGWFYKIFSMIGLI